VIGITIGRPGWYPSVAFGMVLTACYFGWIAVEIFNLWTTRRHEADRQVKDRGSIWVIFAGVFVATSMAFLARSLKWGILTGATQYFGLALMLAGIAFREWSIMTLGRNFSEVVVIDSDQRLVTRGPYRWLRHPAYTGGLMTMTGLPLALGTWLGALVAFIALLGAYTYRVRVEEQALLAAFGDEYRAYIRHTSRFFPGW
jgi:protein-S-isoprenylcysteine O-methyltransferase Ste14